MVNSVLSFSYEIIFSNSHNYFKYHVILLTGVRHFAKIMSNSVISIQRNIVAVS